MLWKVGRISERMASDLGQHEATFRSIFLVITLLCYLTARLLWLTSPLTVPLVRTVILPATQAKALGHSLPLLSPYINNFIGFSFESYSKPLHFSTPLPLTSFSKPLLCLVWIGNIFLTDSPVSILHLEIVILEGQFRLHQSSEQTL